MSAPAACFVHILTERLDSGDSASEDEGVNVTLSLVGLRDEEV